MRSNPAELPSYHELCEILAHEASRPLPKGKENLHYGSFETIIRLLRRYDLPTRFFEEEASFEDFKDEALFESVSLMFAELIEKIAGSRDDSFARELFDELYDYLSEEDAPQSADLIFVFGSKATLRTEKAVKLYQQGLARKVVISGKGPFYELGKDGVPEARILGEYALAHGVQKEDLILEDESVTVPDNVKRSLNLFEERSIPHRSIILVNSPFSQRRGWAHFSKMTEEGTRLFRANTDTVSEQYSKNGWYKDKTGTKVIIKEFFGLRMSHLLNTS